MSKLLWGATMQGTIRSLLLAATTIICTHQAFASDPVTESEKESIATQFSRCWDFYARNKSADTPVVMVRAQLAPDGSIAQATRVDDPRYYSDSGFRLASDNAVRAVFNCSPIKFPQGKYDGTKELLLTFDPRTSGHTDLPTISTIFDSILDWLGAGDSGPEDSKR